MSNISIRVERIGKLYHIGRQQERYETLRDNLADALASPFRKAVRLLKGERSSTSVLDETIWALLDVSFEIKQGEVVGIIGNNGAGKSTLLKILSRITEPTRGFADIYGRVGALLEVGTGFHRELTGRENIYLNGAILGMKRVEIKKKFDEIVNFAEVEQFIDTPVKHYSSGMYLRLAFSVAAHLEPEVLIIDEVLAVGDGRFQKKCINRMEEVGKEGRTVLFVSHNMPAITRLCNRAILLQNGQMVQDGPAHQVVNRYLSSETNTTACHEWTNQVRAPGGEIVRLVAVRVKDENGKISENFDIRCSVYVEMEYEVLKSGYAMLPNFDFFNIDGVHIFKTLDQDLQWRNRPRPKGRYVSTTIVPENFLTEGMVFVTAALTTIDPLIPQFHERDVVCFQVVDNLNGDTARGDYAGRIGGVVRPLLTWSTQYSPNEH